LDCAPDFFSVPLCPNLAGLPCS